MTDLGTGIVRAGVDLAVDDDTAANACSESDADSVLSTLCSAGYELAVCSSISVVLDEYRLVDSLLDILHHRSVLKAQVVGVLDDTCCAVSDSGSTNADPLDIVDSELCVLYSLKSHSCHIVSNFLFGTGAVCLGACLCNDVVLLVYHSGNDISTA